MPMLVYNNTLKGKHKAPRFRVVAEEYGIPFTKVYRSEKAARKLADKPGITKFELFNLQ